jgi:hypothetical protein
VSIFTSKSRTLLMGHRRDNTIAPNHEGQKLVGTFHLSISYLQYRLHFHDWIYISLDNQYMQPSPCPCLSDNKKIEIEFCLKFCEVLCCIRHLTTKNLISTIFRKARNSRKWSLSQLIYHLFNIMLASPDTEVTIQVLWWLNL